MQNGEYDKDGLHVGSTLYTLINPSEGACQNDFYGNYAGGSNPKLYSKKDSYAMPPIDDLDYAAFLHDKDYDRVGARGAAGAFLDVRVTDADAKLFFRCQTVEYSISPYKMVSRKALSAFAASAVLVKSIKASNPYLLSRP